MSEVDKKINDSTIILRRKIITAFRTYYIHALAALIGLGLPLLIVWKIESINLEKPTPPAGRDSSATAASPTGRSPDSTAALILNASNQNVTDQNQGEEENSDLQKKALVNALKAEPFRTDSITLFNREWEKKNKEHFFGWISLILFIVILGAYYYYRILRSQKKFLADVEANKDPEDLNKLFSDKKNQEVMKKLETPRKIKRFANKLRLQYYLLSEEKHIKSYNDLKFLFDTLLFIEKDRMIMMGTYENFKIKYLGENSEAKKEKLTTLIFNLNKKVLV